MKEPPFCPKKIMSIANHGPTPISFSVFPEPFAFDLISIFLFTLKLSIESFKNECLKGAFPTELCTYVYNLYIGEVASPRCIPGEATSPMYKLYT